jgi:curli biogenesis system outer membrane secretion channel CsgG
MKSRVVLAIGTLCVALAVLAGCATSDAAVVTVSANYAEYNPQVFAVLPFDVDPAENRYIQEEIEDYEEMFGPFAMVTEDGAKTVRNAFEDAFVGSGADVVVRSRLNAVLDELEFQNVSGLTDEERAEVSSILNADAIIVGTVSQYNGYEVSFTVRAIDVERGVVLFSGSATGEVWDYDDDPAIAARVLSTELVEYLVDELAE